MQPHMALTPSQLRFHFQNYIVVDTMSIRYSCYGNKSMITHGCSYTHSYITPNIVFLISSLVLHISAVISDAYIFTCISNNDKHNILEKVSNMKSWIMPDPDILHSYWLKKLTLHHKCLTDSFHLFCYYTVNRWHHMWYQHQEEGIWEPREIPGADWTVGGDVGSEAFSLLRGSSHIRGNIWDICLIKS